MATKPNPINVDDLTLRQIKEIAALLPAPIAAPPPTQDFGYCIAVLDRGFVYVGHASLTNDTLLLKDARNIRIWGTKKGLHQLVNSGPQADTKLDEAAEVRVPWRAVISLHPTKEEMWKKS